MLQPNNPSGEHKEQHPETHDYIPLSEQTIISTLARHMLLLQWRYFDLTGQFDIMTISGFVISVHEHWFFVTAGHVFDEIEQAKKQGYKHHGWEIVDNLAQDTETGKKAILQACPIDIDNTPKLCYFNDPDDGIDYAAVYLSPFYRNYFGQRVVPLEENRWRHAEELLPDVALMLGFPASAKQQFSLELTGTMLTSVSLRPTQTIPESLRKPFNRLYAKLNDDVLNIKGMSGGPIFVLKTNNGEILDYQVIAIQSGWDKETRVIAGCWLDLFANDLYDRIIQSEQEWETQKKNEIALDSTV